MKPTFFALNRCCLAAAAVLVLGLAQQAASQGVNVWGSNAYNQSVAQTGQFVALAAGPNHSLAIRKDGTLHAWGYNSDGQTIVPPGTYKAVAGGSYHSLAIRDDGTLAAWGHNGWGQCNVPAGTFKAVAAGAFNSLAIRTDGTLVGWGHNAYGQTNVPAGTYTAIAARQAHCLALRSDGVLVGWGTNEYGQRTIPPGTYKAVSTGFLHTLAIRTDGTVVGFGSNASGQTTAQAGTFVAVAAGYEHSLAIRSDGTLHAWGNLVGGLGSLPTGRFQAVASGTYHSLALEAPKWTFASLHPAGAWYSAAWAAGDGQIGGVANHANYGNAALWTDLTVASYVDLSGDLDASEVWDVAGGVQVGSFSNIAAGTNAANLWQGLPTTFLSLPQHDYRYGVAAGTDGHAHAGSVLGANNDSVAVLWTGTTASALALPQLLYPQTAERSFAYGVADGVQVGSATFAGQAHASVWYGDAASWVDIHPAGAGVSEAFRTDGTQHVGHLWNHLGQRAVLWTSNSQWTDLTPLGYDGASAYNLGFGHQVGHATMGGMPRAMIWSGSAGHYEDLHDYLPIEYAAGGSYAWDLDVRDGMLVVVGEAFNTVTGQSEAVIWIADAPNQAPVAVLPAGGTITLNPGETATTLVLNGSGSSDPDNDVLTYSWTSDPAELLQGATGPVQTVGVGVGTFTFTLTVTDPEGASDSATATYTVVPGNRPPVANAGPDQTLTVPHDGSPLTRHMQVPLNAGGSTDPDGDSLTYQWALPQNGSDWTWSGPSIQVGLPAGVYTFVLRVTDTSGLWSEDEVIMTVLPEPNQPPVVNAGSDMVLVAPKGVDHVNIDPVIQATDPDWDFLYTSFGSSGVGNAGRRVSLVFGIGITTMTFTATDSYGEVGEDTLVVTVLAHPGGAHEGPKAKDDHYQLAPGDYTLVYPMSNDTHTENLPFSILGVTSRVGDVYFSTLVGGPLGIYVPPSAAPGNYEAEYFIVDAQGRTDVGKIRVQVKKK